jgi:thioredoxin reductase (NADPH)
MSHYLIEQIRPKSNIAIELQSEVRAVYGDTHLTEIEITNRATNEVRRRQSGGLFVFIGADAETNWLPVEIARDDRGYVLTINDVVKAGCRAMAAIPISSKQASPASMLAAMCD